jgi:hypothetical protein
MCPDLRGKPDKDREGDGPLASNNERSRWEWQHLARRAISLEIGRHAVRQQWFAPLVRAAIYDPNPSFNRQLVEPALKAFGRRRVQLALLEYLKTGTDPERAGAARAWYWTGVSITRDPTAENQAEYDAFADLRREWRDAALHVFVTNEDLDVRRCILPGLDLRAQQYPPELRKAVAEAIRIARTHPDDYLRHRIEHQI